MDGRQRTVLAVASASGFMVFLDATVVNVAFPSVAESFPGSSRADLSWVLSAYSIVFAALLVPGGRLADLLGRRRAFVWGLTLFVAASALCAVAPTVELLIAARVLQAAGGALVVPTSQALLMAAFPAERRGAAIGLWSAAAGVAAALGPPLGGLLVEASSWRLVFFANLPVGAAALLGARALTDQPSPATRPRIDLAGSALVVGVVGSLALAIVQGGEWGWTDARIVTAGTVSAVLGVVLVARCMRSRDPVIAPELLRIRTFAVASAGTLVLGIALFAFLLGGVLFLTSAWNYDVLQAGLAMTPMPVVGAVTSVIGGRLVDRSDPRLIAVPGAACLALAALYIGATAGFEPDFLRVWLPATALAGAGVGFGFATLGTIAVVDLPPDQFSAGSGVSAMTRQLGAVLGVALLVAAVGTPGRDELLAAFDRGWTVVGLAAVCGSAIAALLGKPRRRGSYVPPAILSPAASGRR